MPNPDFLAIFAELDARVQKLASVRRHRPLYDRYGRPTSLYATPSSERTGVSEEAAEGGE